MLSILKLLIVLLSVSWTVSMPFQRGRVVSAESPVSLSSNQHGMVGGSFVINTDWLEKDLKIAGKGKIAGAGSSMNVPSNDNHLVVRRYKDIETKEDGDHDDDHDDDDDHGDGVDHFEHSYWGKFSGSGDVHSPPRELSRGPGKSPLLSEMLQMMKAAKRRKIAGIRLELLNHYVASSGSTGGWYYGSDNLE